MYKQAEQLVQTLKAGGQRLAVVESCTGGALAEAITAVPGSSAVFAWGLVLYDHGSKHQFLDCDPQVFIKQGSVSEASVIELASKAQKASGADIAIALSGIAGPGGGSPDKPVGTCWMALATQGQSKAALYAYDLDRAGYRKAAVTDALALIQQVCAQDS